MDDVLIGEFKAEADEHLADLESGFLALEQNPSGADSDLVDTLFRAAHSLKGGSAFLGLEHISSLAHGLESLLALVRNHELTPEAEHIDALLKGVDVLKLMVADPSAPPPSEAEEATGRLAWITARPPEDPPPPEWEPEIPGVDIAPPPDFAKLQQNEQKGAGSGGAGPSAGSPPARQAPKPRRETTAPAQHAGAKQGSAPAPQHIAAPPSDMDTMLLNEFRAEAEEHIADIEETFLALEAQGLEPDPELADKVFRAAHSLKGGAAFAGLSAISTLAHAMETLLSRVRTTGLVTRSAHADAMLAAVDMLKVMIADPMRSHRVDASHIEAELARLSLTDPSHARETKQAEPGAPAPESLAPDPDPLAPEPMVQTPPSRAASSAPATPDPAELEAIARGETLYKLNVDLSRLPTGLTPSGLFTRLNESGEVLRASLDLAEPGDPHQGHMGRLTFAALWASELDKGRAAVVTGLSPTDLVVWRGASSPVSPVRKSSVPASAGTVPAAAPPSGQAPAPRAEQTSSPAVHAQPRDSQGANMPVPAKAHKPGDSPASDRSGTVRLGVELLDKLMSLAGELVLVRNQQLLTIKHLGAGARDMVQRLDLVTTELQETIMRTRMQPIGNVLGKLPRIVRDLAARLNKRIRLTISGSDVELDKTILESLTDPLTHIIRNACDHGVEPTAEREAQGKPPEGQVTVKAYHEGGQIVVEFSDDGRGMDPVRIRERALKRGLRTEAELAQMSDREALSLIMLPGFSTVDDVSEVSGRGVGMDVVKHAIEELGGSLEVESWPGQGSTFTLRMPLTLAIIPCLLVQVAGERFAIPQVNLDELVTLYDEEMFSRVEAAGNQEVYRLRDRLLPLVRLDEVLMRAKPFDREVKAEIAETYRARNQKLRQRFAQAITRSESLEEFTGALNFAVVKVGSERCGLIVDRILGTEEIVVKPMHQALKWLKCWSGATVMGDGSVALILDIEGVAQHAGVFLDLKEEDTSVGPLTSSAFDTQSVLLFKHGADELFALALPLIRRIEKISMREVEHVGSREFITIDGVSTRIIRLDKVLPVSTPEDVDEMFLILPKFAPKPFGLLMRDIRDILERPISLNTETYAEDGLLGTDVIDGRMALFPDIYRLVEKAEPEWFKDRGRPEPPGNILLVEDSAFMRHMVRKFLEADGYKVLEAEDGKQALEVLKDNEFDAVVSDIEMPVMNGLEFIRNVRAHHSRPDIPAMALTALKTDKDRRQALASGFDDYHIKIDREGFLHMVAGLVEAGRRTKGRVHAQG